jgi:hypothetical protein
MPVPGTALSLARVSTPQIVFSHTVVIMKAMMQIPGTKAALLLLFVSRLVLSSATVAGDKVRQLGGPVEGEDLVSAPHRRQLVS